jgi:NADH dehydrogenase
VVVVGGGFAGLQTVRSLKRADVDVTLVDRHVYNTFQPLLYQVATAALNAGDITYFLRSSRAHQDNVRYRKGAVTGVDPQLRTVTLDSGDTLTYDYLVIGTGVTTNWFGISGAAQNAMAMYTRKQALVVRDRLFTVLEQAAAQGHPRDLRFVVVGGGATGVEMAGALAEMRNNAITRTYPELNRDRVHITLIEMAPHVLAPFAPKLRDYAARELVKRDVDLRLATSVSEVRPDAVVVDDDEVLTADMVVWATGVTVHEVVSTWGLPQGRGGRILVEADLRVPGSSQPGTSRCPRTTRWPSWRSRRSRAASTSPSRSNGWSRVNPPRRSATATRAPWLRSAAGPRSPRSFTSRSSRASSPG